MITRDLESTNCTDRKQMLCKQVLIISGPRQHGMLYISICSRISLAKLPPITAILDASFSQHNTALPMKYKLLTTHLSGKATKTTPVSVSRFHFSPTHVTKVYRLHMSTTLRDHWTYCHWLIRTSRLHLIIGTLSLLTSRAFPGIRLSLVDPVNQLREATCRWYLPVSHLQL